METRILKIKHVNFAFQLIQFEEIAGYVTMSDQAHESLYHMRQVKGMDGWHDWVTKNNQERRWRVTLEAHSDKGVLEHSGLRMVSITVREPAVEAIARGRVPAWARGMTLPLVFWIGGWLLKGYEAPPWWALPLVMTLAAVLCAQVAWFVKGIVEADDNNTK